MKQGVKEKKNILYSWGIDRTRIPAQIVKSLSSWGRGNIAEKGLPTRTWYWAYLRLRLYRENPSTSGYCALSNKHQKSTVTGWARSCIARTGIHKKTQLTTSYIMMKEYLPPKIKNKPRILLLTTFIEYCTGGSSQHS